MKWVVRVLVDMELNKKYVVQEMESRRHSGICYCDDLDSAQKICDALNAMEAMQ